MASTKFAVLGVNFSGADPNAALVVDGEIRAAVEEERFIRDKHAVNRFPTRAVGYCLELAQRLGVAIDAVALGWDCDKYSGSFMREFYEREVNAVYPVDEATRAWQGRMIATFTWDNVTRQVEAAFRANGWEGAIPPIRAFGHHQTHAAGAFLMSPFERAVVLTLDGSGDEICTGLWRADGEIPELVEKIPIPHSVGWFYAALTEYLGFSAYDGEYKVMGLAPYGKPDPTVAAALRKVLTPSEEGYRLDPNYIHYGAHTYSGRFTDAFAELLGQPPRTPETEPTAFHQSVALEGQTLFEEVVVGLARRLVEQTGIRNVCLAGGAALNCKTSQRILTSDFVDDVFVLPSAGDGGQALSAAVICSYRELGRRPTLTSMGLGPSFTDDRIEAILSECLLPRERPDDAAVAAAEDLAAGRVVGWFSGPMEFGPRALGQRSILADPRDVAFRDKVNRVIKYREYWRPFCPSILAERAADYFESAHTDARFMAITLPVRPEKAAEIPAVVHVDGTSRPQFVHAEASPDFHRLISAFAERSGVPVVLNTSFNVRGEPIVCTPKDAIRHFYSSGMDVLYLGSFRLAK